MGVRGVEPLSCRCKRVLPKVTFRENLLIFGAPKISKFLQFAKAPKPIMGPGGVEPPNTRCKRVSLPLA